MFGEKRQVLDIPPAVARDSQAVEIARIWAGGGGQHVSLRADVWADPAAWGVLLVDLAKHLANAYGATGRDPADSLSRIKAGFDAEWSHATDAPTGKLLR